MFKIMRLNGTNGIKYMVVTYMDFLHIQFLSDSSFILSITFGVGGIILKLELLAILKILMPGKRGIRENASYILSYCCSDIPSILYNINIIFY